MRLVALLRGVNVGGANVVPMSELRVVFQDLGYTEVTTFIQSGNVVFTAARPVRPERLEAAVAKRFSVETAVIIRTGAALEATITGDPFPKADRSKLHVGFLTGEPSPAVVSQLEPDRYPPEQFALRGQEIYLHLPRGVGRAKVPAYLDRQLDVPMTVRNWNTVTKLRELAES